MWFKILSGFIVLMLLYRRWKLRRLRHLYEQIKSNYPTLPLLGHAYELLKGHEAQMKTFNKFGLEAIDKGGMTGFWIGDVLFVVVVDPEIAEILLKTYLEKGDIMRFLRTYTGNGSIFAPVSIWRPRRKILLPTFSARNLASFVSIFARQSSIMAQRLRARTAGPFAFFPYITGYAMDAVCESTFGVKLNVQENPDHIFHKAFEEVAEIASNRMVTPWEHNDVMYSITPAYKRGQALKKVLFDFIYNVIKSKKKIMNKENDDCNIHKDQADKYGSVKSFLDLMMENSEGGCTDLELMEEAFVIISAGTDTSATGAAFTALMLARHQHIQDKVYEEIKQVFGNSDRPVENDDLANLKYLNAAIKESLRLYPPVPMVVRKVDKDYTMPSGLTIVKGCTLLFNIWATHRNPRYWGADADRFRPERFLEAPLKHPAQFMPFSYGVRNCIGYGYAFKSMMTVLTTLLRDFRLLSPSTPGTTTCSNKLSSNPKCDEPLKVHFKVMMKDVDNFTLELERRDVGDSTAL